MTRSKRVGAHRLSSRRSWPRWMILLAGLAVAIVLAAAGLFALDAMQPRIPAPTEIVAETVTDPSTLDPSLDASITVLDAGGDQSLVAGAGQALLDRGWNVVATGGSAEVSETTIVWFETEALGPAARGIVQALGVGEARPSEGRLSGTPITIVLGADAVGSVPSVAPRDDSVVVNSPAAP